MLSKPSAPRAYSIPVKSNFLFDSKVLVSIGGEQNNFGSSGLPCPLECGIDSKPEVLLALHQPAEF